MRHEALRRATILLAILLVVPARLPGEPSGHTATGTLVAYDAASRILTLSSATGSMEFRVSPDARAWLGNRRLPIAQLPAHTGAQVTVSWADVDGVRTTHTVRVSSETTEKKH